MKNTLILIVIGILLNTTIYADGGSKYGKELTLKEKTNISEIMENPKSFVGKRVLVEGTVVDVCSKRGCWLEIASDKEFQKIKVKVNDGEIVFPMEAKGKTALVEGEVYEINLTKEQAIQVGEHEAQEHGTKFDSTTVKGPQTIYQIKGIGALIK